jgi:hypothetical protein
MHELEAGKKDRMKCSNLCHGMIENDYVVTWRNKYDKQHWWVQ